MKENTNKICEKADCYFEGKNNIKKDYLKALSLYKQAAKQGNCKAQYMIGYMYHNGLGVEKDYREAFYWFEKASSNNYSLAKKYVELYYNSGFHIWR